MRTRGRVVASIGLAAFGLAVGAAIVHASSDDHHARRATVSAGRISQLGQATPAEDRLGAVNGAMSGVEVVRVAGGIVQVITGGPGPSCTTTPVAAYRLSADSVSIVMSRPPEQPCFFSFHVFDVPVSFDGIDDTRPLQVTVTLPADPAKLVDPLIAPAAPTTLHWTLRSGV